MLNPFGAIFESLEGPSGPVVESVHQAAYERLLDLIESEEGHLVSLRAPRAGYGKTMLLARVNEKIRDTVTVVPVHLAGGQRITGARILEDLLTRFARNIPALSGETRLDLCIRKLFAQGLLPLVCSGEVPCQDKDRTIGDLRERPTEVFDFRREDATIARWSKDHFNVLSPLLTSVLSKASGASSRDTSYWIDLLFNYATRPPQEVSRVGDLITAVFGDGSRFRTDAGYLEGLGAFLKLMTLVEPVVLVLDEVDGLAGDPDAALRVTSKLIFLWETCRRVNIVVSVNDDVWDSAFLPQLPDGFLDRLEDAPVRLRPLTEEAAYRLISARAGAESSKIINKLNLSPEELYPRAVLRAARDLWGHRDKDRVTEGDSALAEGPENQSPGAPLKASGQLGDLSSGFALPEAQPLFSSGVFPVMQAVPDSSHSDQGVKPTSPAKDFSKAMDPGPPKALFPESPFSLGEASVEVSKSPPETSHQETLLPSASPVDPVSRTESSDDFPDKSAGLRDPARRSFDPAIAIEALKNSEEPFAKVPVFGSDQENPLKGVEAVQQSPFEIVKPVPASRSRQASAPSGDVDAIDELLRQFREHRDS